jgi:hypothetical protein
MFKALEGKVSDNSLLTQMFETRNKFMKGVATKRKRVNCPTLDKQ